MKTRPITIAIACLLHATVLNAADRKPNFLFIYTDDQRWDAMGVVQREQGDAARFPWLKTPHMDRLAAEGVRFRNAFVTLSLCAPSRSAFLTGRYNHNNGVIDNHTPFPVDNVSHASLMRAAGYTTAYIGKWHHGTQSGKRPGFDYSASFVGQGHYFDCPVEINGKSTPTKGWIDDVSTDYAIDFIKQHRDTPFSMILGFKSPHGPRGGENLPERLRSLFKGEKSRPVPNLLSPAIYRTTAGQTKPRPDLTRQAAGPMVVAPHLDYMRHIAGADEGVGRILKTLDDLELTDQTVIVFTSDNGYYLGEHGLGDKRSMYEESLRIPMLVRYPKLFPKGGTCDDMVLNIDLAPTFLDLAGVPVPDSMQGKSWVPLLTGEQVDWRKSFLAEYFFEERFENTPTLVGIRTTRGKLVRYPGHPEWTEAFDLSADPYETDNLIQSDTAGELSRQLKKELNEQIKATGYHEPPGADKPGAAGATTGKKPKGGGAGKRK
ncbi:acetylglucosamine-6-sulfatase [Haloferula helveola]|uniref:Acetylglucosamine-6-sulfatase n=1 Tax=Haloferula helveola TaxID=490095 RepID=A0ABN6H2Z5_9BACT|nr:acetylglucosamine-6-sulfatase [Haloferula helveola]